MQQKGTMMKMIMMIIMAQSCLASEQPHQEASFNSEAHAEAMMWEAWLEVEAEVQEQEMEDGDEGEELLAYIYDDADEDEEGWEEDAGQELDEEQEMGPHIANAMAEVADIFLGSDTEEETEGEAGDLDWYTEWVQSWTISDWANWCHQGNGQWSVEEWQEYFLTGNNGGGWSPAQWALWWIAGGWMANRPHRRQ